MSNLVIRGGTLVDPLNGRRGVGDLVVEGQRIAEVGHECRVPKRAQVVDATGMLVMPGLVDTHVHVGGQYRKGHAMMARAGVTTALNLSGSIADVIDGIHECGVGLTLASLDSLAPESELPSASPTAAEIRDAIELAIQGGAFGIKILGGHYPFTPDATADIIRIANELGVYVAFHVGSTAHGSNIEGLREAAELADGQPLHIAHVNSYCRGMIEPAIDEAREAIDILSRTPALRSESYLALINGTSGRCVAGRIASGTTQNALRMRGYDVDEGGLAKAITDGYCLVLDERGDESILLRGESAHNLWREMGTNVGISFPINDPTSQFILATARHPDGRYVVDALSTDGGGIPRNVTIERGLALVALDALSLDGFVVKASLAPARMIGLEAKGHFTPGADADVILVDPTTRRVRATIARGTPIQVDGIVTGTGATLITTERGARSARASGLDPVVVDPRSTGLYRRSMVENLAAVG